MTGSLGAHIANLETAARSFLKTVAALTLKTSPTESSPVSPIHMIR